MKDRVSVIAASILVAAVLLLVVVGVLALVTVLNPIP